MVDRICISINNECNMMCKYCHFRQKEDCIDKKDMNFFRILSNVTNYIDKYSIPKFKIGFVGNGEPFINYGDLKEYVLYIKDYLEDGIIEAYTITNGTLITEEQIRFLNKYHVNVGFSLDGYKELHDKFRLDKEGKGTFEKVLYNIERFKDITGHYPSLNPTVSRTSYDNKEEIISFFKKFDVKITFSRMIGDSKESISLEEYRGFIDYAKKHDLSVREGDRDCTIYGGKCGAGINNLFFANANIYICGNCIDLAPIAPSNTPLDKINLPNLENFDRSKCFKESLKEDNL